MASTHSPLTPPTVAGVKRAPLGCGSGCLNTLRTCAMSLMSPSAERTRRRTTNPATRACQLAIVVSSLPDRSGGALAHAACDALRRHLPVAHRHHALQERRLLGILAHQHARCTLRDGIGD